MLIEGKGLLVSLPPEELRGFSPPASLFRLADLHGVALSAELRWALHAATKACEAAQVRMILAARPEIFTHGASLAWLQDQLMGIRDHLILSDGTAMRPIRDMRNHLFVYTGASPPHAAAFARLTGWLPELFECLYSQVNNCHSVRVAGRSLRPATQLLMAGLSPAAESSFYAYRSHTNVDLSIRRTLGTTVDVPRRLRQLRYIPLTETACHDVPFMRQVAALIRGAQRSTGAGVILRLPCVARSEDLEPRLQLALTALRVARLKPPKSGTLLFATDDPSVDLLRVPERPVALLAHPTYEFWRGTSEYLASFRSLEVAGEGAQSPGSWQQLLREAAGMDP